MLQSLRKIFIVGGTHGNERGGIHLARHFNGNTAFPALQVHGVVANERAALQNTRYFHEDLNRCFSLARLRSPTTETYESKRAQELNALMGPKSLPSVSPSSANADFIFDLHNSTSNTGMMLCLHRKDSLALEVAAHLHRLDARVKIVFWSKELGEDQPFLPTIGKSGMTVELGSVCHGTVNSIALERVRVLLEHALEYLNRRVTTAAAAQGEEEAFVEHCVNIGERKFAIDFPRDDAEGRGGDATAFIHAALQGMEELADDSYLRDGQPLFSGVDGKDVVWFDAKQYDAAASGTRLYPVFVNEAAYFEKQTAFFLYERIDAVPVRVLKWEQQQ